MYYMLMIMVTELDLDKQTTITEHVVKMSHTFTLRPQAASTARIMLGQKLTPILGLYLLYRIV